MFFMRQARRKLSVAAIILMALQLFGSAMAMAREVQSAALHSQGKQIVICSVHGTMVIDWDGPAPAKKPARGCAFCLTGASLVSAKAPALQAAVYVVFLPITRIATPPPIAEPPLIAVRSQVRPSSPRAPPANV